MGRVAIIGDTGGHATALTRALTTLGADPATGHIPADLHIVHVGDLIHRGPDSPAVIELVHRFHHASPTQWTQLAGNHEAQYLRPPVFTWPERLPDTHAEILREWWESGWMQFATALPTGGQEIRATGGTHVTVGAGDLLITHAGLTAGRWARLGAPTTAADTADAINADARGRADDDWTGVWAPGVMLTRSPDTSAGVLWAAADQELTRSWIHHVAAGHSLPGFHQAHGHSRPAWTSKTGLQWSPVISQIPREKLHRKFDETTGVSRLLVLPDDVMPIADALTGAMALWGTDPGHGTHPAYRWGPLELPT